MPVAKVAYVAHVPGHKNSKGESAPWVIKDHKDDHIISSFSSEAEAKQGLQNMHAHEGSLKTARYLQLDELRAWGRSPEEGRAFSEKIDRELAAKSAATTPVSSLDEFTRAYIEAALWSTNDNSNESGGDPLDSNYGFEDIAPDTLKAIIRDCTKFQNEHAEALEEKGDSQGGHDFWLTRNGHGAGFWDGDWPINGKELTLASKKFGEVDLYVGDDGYIYHGGAETPGPVPPRESFEDSLTDEDRQWMRDWKVSGLGVVSNVKSGLLRKKEPKMAFDFNDQSRQYEYEFNGNDVVLISPANTTKLLQGDDARSFGVALDHIENQDVEASQEVYLQHIQALISSYFTRKAASVAIQVDASNIKKASVTFVAGVVLTDEGKVEKFKFTGSKDKAARFSKSEAAKLVAQLKDFDVTGKVV